MRRGRTALASKPRGPHAAKIAGELGKDRGYEGRIGEQVRGLDISGGYETVKCHRVLISPICDRTALREFSELFMSYLLTRNSRIEEDLIDQLFNSSEKRLARLLLLLANFGKEGRPEPIVGNFSQETLAEMIGTTRSRVSIFMNKFRKLGF